VPGTFIVLSADGHSRLFSPPRLSAFFPDCLQLTFREVRGARLPALRAAELAERDRVGILPCVGIVQRGSVQLLADSLLNDVARDGAEVAIF
jgi:hypothetical protein